MFTVVVLKSDGTEERCRLSADHLRAIVAASNMKQRLRMLALYNEAERRHYAVAGTANRNETDLGFFVKFGDGGVDLQPIAHLYKTEVYQIARALGVPAEIITRPPTTDTYMPQLRRRSSFTGCRFPYSTQSGARRRRSGRVGEIATIVGLTAGQVENAMQDLHSKVKAAQYLRSAPLALTRVAA